jgi:putative Flp pilus-assembly TadE/G-like protein
MEINGYSTAKTEIRTPDPGSRAKCVVRLHQLSRDDRHCHSPRDATPMRHTSRLNSRTPTAASHRVGSLLPAIAVALVAVLGGTALVLDRLWLHTSQVELQTTAEAAALAAGRALASDDLLRDEFQPEAFLMKARLAAARIALENSVAGESLILNTDADGDVRFGRLATDETTGETLFLETNSHPTAVAVHARRTQDRDAPVRLPIQSLISPSNADVVAIAEATLDNRVVGLRPVDDLPLPTLPLAILSETAAAAEKPKQLSKQPHNPSADSAQENAQVAPQTWVQTIEQRRGKDRFAFDLSTGQVTEDADGIPEITLRTPSLADRGVVANAFVMTLAGDLTHQDLQRQVRDGWSVADLEPYGGELMLHSGPLSLAGARGIEAAALAEALRGVVGQSRVCLLYDRVDGDPRSTTASLRIIGFVAGRVMSVREVSSGVCEIVFQPAVMSARSAVVAAEIVGLPSWATPEESCSVSPNKYVYKLRLSN